MRIISTKQKKGQESLEYLLIIVAIMFIAVVILLVVNSLLGAPGQASIVQQDKYNFAVNGFELVGYDEPFDGTEATAPTLIISDEGEWSYGGNMPENPGEGYQALGSVSGGGGGSYQTYGETGGGEYIIVVPCPIDCNESERRCASENSYETCVIVGDCPEWEEAKCPKDFPICDNGDCMNEWKSICGDDICWTGENPTNCPVDCCGKGEDACEGTIGNVRQPSFCTYDCEGYYECKLEPLCDGIRGPAQECIEDEKGWWSVNCCMGEPELCGLAGCDKGICL